MVNITKKIDNLRTQPKCIINVPSNVYKAVTENNIKKGDIFYINNRWYN